MKKISNEEYLEILSLYPIWKELNKRIKILYSRGVNFHEVFSEFIVCYVNNYYHSLGEGSEDAFTENMKKVQIKGTSNFNSDLTSFGPKSEFDILEFARLNQDNDTIELYRIPIEDLYEVKVNKKETFKEQQLSKRRPRFSIINQYINPFNLKPYAKIDLINNEITKFL